VQQAQLTGKPAPRQLIRIRAGDVAVVENTATRRRTLRVDGWSIQYRDATQHWHAITRATGEVVWERLPDRPTPGSQETPFGLREWVLDDDAAHEAAIAAGAVLTRVETRLPTLQPMLVRGIGMRVVWSGPWRDAATETLLFVDATSGRLYEYGGMISLNGQQVLELLTRSQRAPLPAVPAPGRV
jgi:hypothetical protein